MSRPLGDNEMKEAIRRLALPVDTDAFQRELSEKCAAKKVRHRRFQRVRAWAIAAGVVVVLAGVSVGVMAGLGHFRSPAQIIVFGDGQTLTSPASGGLPTAITGVRAELYTEIQRVREGLTSGELRFVEWPPADAGDEDLPEDPMVMLDRLEDSVLACDLTVYLRDAEEASLLRAEIAATPGVTHSELIGKEEALGRLKGSFSDNPQIFEAFDADYLPTAIDIWLDADGQVETLADQLRNRTQVDAIRITPAMDHVHWLTRLQSLVTSTDVTLSTEGGHWITEWSRPADGRILCSGEVTEPGFGILECDDNGEPKLTTFDNYEDYSVGREAKGLSPLSHSLGSISRLFSI